MPELLKRLYKLSLWNSSAAGLNFLSNIIIAKVLGVAIFGDLFYLSSLVGVFSLVLIIIPPNYSIIRYQDDDRFKYILGAFYILGWILLVIPVFLLREQVALPFWLFYLFAFSFSLQSYFDIKYQAENKLNRYYLMLFFQALVKITFILAAMGLSLLNGFFELIVIISASQLLISLLYLLKGERIFAQSPAYFQKVLLLIIEKRSLFSTYYLNIGLKKLSGNLIVLLFEPLVAREILGIYALLIKVLQFIQGLIRTIESLLLVKKNQEIFSQGFIKNGIIVGFILQIAHILIGVFYMKYIEGNFHFNYVFAMSFIHYFYVFFIKARAFFISKYQNKPINWSYALFLLPIMILFALKAIPNTSTSLQELITLFIFSSLAQMIYLIVAEKRHLRYPTEGKAINNRD